MQTPTTRYLPPITSLLLLLALPARAGVDFRWTVETSARPVPVEIPIMRGETMTFYATMLTYGSAVTFPTNTAAVLYWQTNGMDDVWWTIAGTLASNVLSATWIPAYDTGATLYTAYLAATNATSGRSYRAHGRLRMIGSPGDSSGGSPPTPTAIWDARYDPAGAAQTVSNALASALQAEAAARASGDAIALTNWQSIVYSLTNGAALGETALQPPATNALAAAAAHAATAHEVTDDFGFQGGTGAAATAGGAIGTYASATWGGAVGAGAKTSMGFAGGAEAYATSDGSSAGYGIDAIQLGSGGNSTALTLQIYDNRLLNADGTIPVARMDLIKPTITNIATAVGQTLTNAMADSIITGNLPVQRWQMFDYGCSSNRWLILTNDVLEIWEQ